MNFRSFLLLCFLLGIYSLHAQRPGKKRKSKGQIEKHAVSLIYGSRFFAQSFENQLNTLDNYSLSMPLQMPGIALSSNIIITRGWPEFPGTVIFAHMIPADIIINDTVRCKLTGGLLHLPVYGIDLFRKSSNFAFYANAGFCFGRLRIYQNDFARMKNPYISPTISLEPKVLLGAFSLSVIASYSYDISDPNWKKSWLFDGKVNKAVKKYRQTAVNAFLCLGLRFG